MSRSWIYPALLSVTALFGAAYAPQAAAEGDAARGKTLGYTCLGCHGVPNYKSVYPTYSVPMLKGQHPEYIVTALKAYKSGERGHATMHAHAVTLSDQDMQDVAAFLSGNAIKAVAGAAPAGEIPAAVATCSACHGREGIGIMGIYPTLSGQHADYLEHTLEQYRKGGRRNGIMAPFAGQLKEADIKIVAEYYAKQKPALQTVPRRKTVLSAAQ
ncbi:MAG TPA: c-type cytochrome [Steroidobacteraceae bacterium]|jgi:cytochrome c553|nr:c-type cytochrome [Steroidobacteraceae bacterium]